MKTGLQIQEEAWRAFEVWVSQQDDETQELDIMSLVELYSSSATQVAKEANQNVPGARMGGAGETISVKVA